jgi:long-chain acyl-CoA synthetase
MPDGAPRTLGELAGFAARNSAGRVALLTSEGRWTFSEVGRETLSTARALTALGLAPGERVAVLLPNGVPYFILYFAIPTAGGVAVPVNTFLAAPEVATILEDCDARILITTARRAAALAPRLKRMARLHTVIIVPGEEGVRDALPGHVRRVSWEELKEPDGRVELPPPPDPSGVAVLTYTSGTTGKMKGVMLSHDNLLSNARSALEAVKLRSRDRLLLFLPMFHSLTQMVCLVTPRLAGLPVILLPGVDRPAIMAALRRFRPTIFVAVPAIYSAMSERSPGFFTRMMNPVRLYISGGSPLPADVLERFERNWRRPLCEGYGLSEAAPVVSLNPVDGMRKAGSVGPAVPGVTVRVLCEDGVEVPAGEVGELVIEGPNVMLGYHGQEEETRAALKDGWLHTGDLARIDEDGYIFIVGRKKEMLIFRGMNIYPREVEEVLARHPAVSEAAVVGIEDPEKGEVPHAAVALGEGMSASGAELRKFCQERLARYKIPRTITVLPALPKGATGKILKDQVKEEIIAARVATPRERRTPPDA